MQVHESILPDPHWCLWILGVEPEHQGDWLATKLLQARLNQVDCKGLPCYLEAHDEQNHSFYSRAGFELVCSVNVPGGDLVFWCYLRKLHHVVQRESSPRFRNNPYLSLKLVGIHFIKFKGLNPHHCG